MILANNAEGGTNGTTLTTANSGGASGDPWDTVFQSTGAGTVAYDSAQTAHGGLSIRHATGASSDSIQLQWAASTANPARMWGRYYYRCTSLSIALDLHRVRSSTSNQVARLTVTATTGLLQLRNGANSIVATATNAIAINTWYRLEWDFRPGASVTNTAVLYAADSVVPIETLSASSSYSTDTDCGQFHLGNMSAQANVGDRWFDDVAVTDTGWLGPAAPRRLSALGVG